MKFAASNLEVVENNGTATMVILRSKFCCLLDPRIIVHYVFPDAKGPDGEESECRSLVTFFWLLEENETVILIHVSALKSRV